jgi:hypothetical protein
MIGTIEPLGIQSFEQLRDHIADEYVIPRLLARAVYPHRLASQHALAEDGDDPGFAVRVLARTVDVDETERGERQAARRLEKRTVMLGCDFGDGVG